MTTHERITRVVTIAFFVLALLLFLPGQRAAATHGTFAAGDVFVSLKTSEVQWRHPDGSLNQILQGLVPGRGSPGVV